MSARAPAADWMMNLMICVHLQLHHGLVCVVPGCIDAIATTVVTLCVHLNVSLADPASLPAALSCCPSLPPYSPYVIGALYEKTGAHFSGMYVMGAGLAVAALIVAAYLPRWSEAKAMPHAPSSPNMDASKDAKSVEV